MFSLLIDHLLIKNYQVNAVLRKTINYKIKFKNPNNHIKSKLLNHPEWLYSKWISDNCEQYAKKMAIWNNTIPLTWFRVNKLRYNNKSFISYLKLNDISFKQYKHNNIYFNIKQSSLLIHSELFKEGKITVQNPFSGFVCKLMDLKEKIVLY